MGWSSGIEVGADELAAVVDPTDLGVISTEGIDQGKGAVVQKVSARRVERASVADLAVGADDLATVVDVVGRSRQGAREVDGGEDAFVPPSTTAPVPQETMDGPFGVEVEAHDLTTAVDADGFGK